MTRTKCPQHKREATPTRASRQDNNSHHVAISCNNSLSFTLSTTPSPPHCYFATHHTYTTHSPHSSPAFQCIAGIKVVASHEPQHSLMLNPLLCKAMLGINMCCCRCDQYLLVCDLLCTRMWPMLGSITQHPTKRPHINWSTSPWRVHRTPCAECHVSCRPHAGHMQAGSLLHQRPLTLRPCLWCKADKVNKCCCRCHNAIHMMPCTRMEPMRVSMAQALTNTPNPCNAKP
jgi:hypothetical protein